MQVRVAEMGAWSNIPHFLYRDEIYSLQILLCRTQAGPGRTVKKEQEEFSPNNVQRINLISCTCGPVKSSLTPVKTKFSSGVLNRLRSPEIRSNGARRIWIETAKALKWTRYALRGFAKMRYCCVWSMTPFR